MSGEVDPRCAYTLPHYRHILRLARERYWLPKVRDVAFERPTRDFFLIRHDVDITPWAALEMAELEKAEGVETTYYFRLHAPYYNLLDPKAVDVVQAIAAMGHEVGLHYEPGFFIDMGRDPVEGTQRDIRIFEELVGFETKTIAQHQPHRGFEAAEFCPVRPCAYGKELVHEIPYFGDSGFKWREGCICTKLGQLPQLHTLIHPHSWCDAERPWREVLRDRASDLNRRLSAEMEAYIEHVVDYLARRDQLDRDHAERYQQGS